MRIFTRRIYFLAILVAILGCTLAPGTSARAGAAQFSALSSAVSPLVGRAEQPHSQSAPSEVQGQWQCAPAYDSNDTCQPSRVLSNTLYLPLVGDQYPWVSPLGIQSSVRLTTSGLLTYTQGLRAGWVRIGPLSWRTLQPNEGDPLRWGAVADIERELRAVARAGLVAEISVNDAPRWATINVPYPTSCGAIRTDKFAAFAAFMRAVVARYAAPEFGIWNWELGNEIDVDPRLVIADSIFGCWGDIRDPYYGGRHYGEMLKVVAPAIRAANPAARIWLGGLLLDSPATTDPSKGHPEQFLKGILEAGAAPYFDLVAYHSYPPYLNHLVDPDDPPGGAWAAWGGMAGGKARFLSQILHSYGVDKPLVLNETGFMCPESPPYASWCTPPDESFYRVQAVYLIRAFTRSLAAGVQGMLWFTLNGPGWRYTGLLGSGNNPTPAYRAMQVFNDQIRVSKYLGPIDYGDGIEAYSFQKTGQLLRIIWAKQDQNLAVIIPQAKFIQAVDRNGTPITPFTRGTDYLLVVGFDPIYVTLRPK